MPLLSERFIQKEQRNTVENEGYTYNFKELKHT